MDRRAGIWYIRRVIKTQPMNTNPTNTKPATALGGLIEVIGPGAQAVAARIEREAAQKLNPRADGAQGKHTPTPWRMKNADGSDYYNEHGPTWYAVPSNRSEEFGSRWVWFVADVDDFNEQDLTGNCLAECCSLKEAQAIVTACNTHARLVEALREVTDAFASWQNHLLWETEDAKTIYKARALLAETENKPV